VAAGRAADLAAGVARAAQVLDAGAASLLLQRLRAERRSSDEASAARAATEVRA
jgi:anthranilate phosphoribosyltransferase